MRLSFLAVASAAAALSLVRAPRAPPCWCAPVTKPRRIFFNRVPKCGSTTLMSLIADAAAEHGFTSLRSPDFTHEHLSRAQRQAFVRFFATSAPPFVFNRHLHFVRFDEFAQNMAPVYMNLVRDPAAIRTSDFYFHRECVCTTRGAWCRTEWHRASPALCNRTIDDFYADMRTPVAMPGRLTAYFCGHEKECALLPTRAYGLGAETSEGAREPLGASNISATVATAKRHLRDRYLWVGVLEDWEPSLALLSHLLPGFFGKVNVQYWAQQKRLPHGSRPGAKPSAETLAKMRAELAPDYEVYSYARRLLRCKLRSCGLLQPRGAAAAANGDALALVDDDAAQVDVKLLNREASAEHAGDRASAEHAAEHAGATAHARAVGGDDGNGDADAGPSARELRGLPGRALADAGIGH